MSDLFKSAPEFENCKQVHNVHVATNTDRFPLVIQYVPESTVLEVGRLHHHLANIQAKSTHKFMHKVFLMLKHGLHPTKLCIKAKLTEDHPKGESTTITHEFTRSKSKTTAKRRRVEMEDEEDAQAEDDAPPSSIGGEEAM